MILPPNLCVMLLYEWYVWDTHTVTPLIILLYTPYLQLVVATHRCLLWSPTQVCMFTHTDMH